MMTVGHSRALDIFGLGKGLLAGQISDFHNVSWRKPRKNKICNARSCEALEASLPKHCVTVHILMRNGEIPYQPSWLARQAGDPFSFPWLSPRVHFGGFKMRWCRWHWEEKTYRKTRTWDVVAFSMQSHSRQPVPLIMFLVPLGSTCYVGLCFFIN